MGHRRGAPPHCSVKAVAQPNGGTQPASWTADAAELSDTFAALSDPIRRAIVAQLTGGPRSVTELSAPFAVSAPAISKHLAVLERAGLILRWKVGRVRYCRLVIDPLEQAGSWIERHQTFWERQLDALENYLDRENETCNPLTPRRQK